MLTDVLFISADVGIVVGSGTILRTTDRGITWSAQQIPFPLERVSFVDEKTGAAVGWRWIVRTTDGGLTWEPQEELTESDFDTSVSWRGEGLHSVSLGDSSTAL